jgi:hypothetical protein
MSIAHPSNKSKCAQCAAIVLLQPHEGPSILKTVAGACHSIKLMQLLWCCVFPAVAACLLLQASASTCC